MIQEGPGALERLLIAFLGALPGIIAAVATLFVAIHTARRVNSVKHDVNGRIDQLLEATRIAAAAEAKAALLAEHQAAALGVVRPPPPQ